MFLKVKRKYERQMNERMLFSVNLSDFFYQLRKKFENSTNLRISFNVLVIELEIFK